MFCSLIIYNELLIRGYSVDVGVVKIRNKEGRTYYEIDFVCNMVSNRYYIQSALNIDTPEKNFQESRSLNSIGDNLKKVIVVKDDINAWHNEDVYKYVSKNSSMEIIRKGTDLDSDTAGTEIGKLIFTKASLINSAFGIIRY